MIRKIKFSTVHVSDGLGSGWVETKYDLDPSGVGFGSWLNLTQTHN